MLHEFLVSSDPSAGSPLLTEVGNKFASVGLCEQAGAKNGPAYRGKSAMLVYYTSHHRAKEDTLTELQ